MRRFRLVGLAAVAMISATLLTPATPAHADDTTLYVDRLFQNCSDSGTGTVDEPFCTIGAAVTRVGPGQTVQVRSTGYAERVTVPRSGTAERPITIVAIPPDARFTLDGPTAGFVVNGQSHITIKDFNVRGDLREPGVELSDATGITLDGVRIHATFPPGQPPSTEPAFRLSGVRDSTLRGVHGLGTHLAAGVVVDAESSGVTIASGQFYNDDRVGPGVGIDVAGSATTIRGNQVTGFGEAAIAVRPGAADTLIVNNEIRNGAGDGVQSRGATGTAVTNNDVWLRCGDGIRVDGASVRVSVQNNVVRSKNADGTCATSTPGTVEIGVYGGAVGQTVVDYNNTRSQQLGYAWNQPMTLAAFRAASGQAAHDLIETATSARVDSANSAAPGFPATDLRDRGRGDDPSVPDTGAGPLRWADRGVYEHLIAPTVLATFTHEPGTGWVTVDASTTRPGFTQVASYRFDFGDGTVVTQAGPVARHRYTTHGTRTVSIWATLVDTMTGGRAYQVSFLPRAATIGLLSPAHHRYVGIGRPSKPGAALHADHPTLTAAQAFDLVDVGTDQVALLSHATGGYVTLEYDNGYVATASAAAVGPNETFAMTRYSDGSFSLKASTGRYVSTYGSGGPLVPEAGQVGLTEKFHRVNLADAGKSLRPAVRKQYVTADTAAAKPLTASGTTLGKNQRFDVVDLGSGKVALFAHANNRFVWAPNNGALPLVNSTGAVGPMAMFTLVRNADGTVSLKAAVNNRYVTVGTSTTTPLTASRTSIGLTERFTLR